MPTPLRASVERLPVYTLPVLPEHVDGPLVRLDQNELGVAPSPLAISAATAAMDSLNRYPDISHETLRRAIAGRHGLAVEGTLCGAGSMELMSQITQAYLEPGAGVVMSQYGYKYFQVQCTLAGADVTVVPEIDMRVDIEAIRHAVDQRTRIVYVVNPGNPTGACLPAGALRELRRALPEHVMLVVDCAYAEFAEQAHYDTGFDLVDDGENIVVLRSFSKAYGLAALRVGWLYASQSVVDALCRIRSPNNVSSVGLAAACAAVTDSSHLEKVVSEVVSSRTSLSARLDALGFRVTPSQANFVLLHADERSPLTAKALHDALRARAVMTRPMGSYGLDQSLRITIGSRADMEALDQALGQITAARREP